MRRFSRARRAGTRLWSSRSRSRNGIFVGRRTEIVGGGGCVVSFMMWASRISLDLLTGWSGVQWARRSFHDMYCGLHHGSCAFPMFQIFEVFARLLFVVVHTQSSPTLVSFSFLCCPSIPVSTYRIALNPYVPSLSLPQITHTHSRLYHSRQIETHALSPPRSPSTSS
jgi:hypothetical protein